MHELSLVQGLMEQVRQIARENNRERVTLVRVRIGPFSGVVTESFSFAFHALKTDDNLFSQSGLEIETPEPEFSCSGCGRRFDGSKIRDRARGHDFHLPFDWGRCPACGQEALHPEGGDEILLLQVELE
jgi:hydrogenase nickel incorporation protein HypA/HybF